MTLVLESATLFTPGRASYIDGEGLLQLTDASQHRAEVAAEAFDPNFHDKALFAGGFPGLAQNWAPELTPPPDRREAHLMARPLTNRLFAEEYSAADVGYMVHTQGDSSNSIDDVILSVERGLLKPDDFNTYKDHGIELVTGYLHGVRFTRALSLALDIDPKRIRRVDMRDVYGTPAYPHQPAESRAVAVAKECAGIALTAYVSRNVRPGSLDDLRDASESLNRIIQKQRA